MYRFEWFYNWTRISEKAPAFNRVQVSFLVILNTFFFRTPAQHNYVKSLLIQTAFVASNTDSQVHCRIQRNPSLWNPDMERCISKIMLIPHVSSTTQFAILWADMVDNQCPCQQCKSSHSMYFAQFSQISMLILRPSRLKQLVRTKPWREIFRRSWSAANRCALTDTPREGSPQAIYKRVCQVCGGLSVHTRSSPGACYLDFVDHSSGLFFLVISTRSSHDDFSTRCPFDVDLDQELLSRTECSKLS